MWKKALAFLYNFGSFPILQIAMTATRVRGEDCHVAIDDVVTRGCETLSKCI